MRANASCWKRFLVVILVPVLVPALVAVLPASPALAGSFFLNPRIGLGLTFRGDGQTDSALALGATVGYGINEYLTVDISYTRFIPVSEDYDTPSNLAGAHLTLSKSFAIITPYVRAGPGVYLIEDPDGDDPTGVFLDVGCGVSVSPLPFVGLHAGVNYSIIEGEANILEPMIGFGFSFF